MPRAGASDAPKVSSGPGAGGAVDSVNPILSTTGPVLTASGTVEPVPDFVQTTFDAANFTDPTTIDNPYYPLAPGTRIVLVGEANRGAGELAHRVIITVTDLTKVIDGVRTRVVWERDINEGTQVETELSFFAQDDDGNVWNLGEYPEEYEARTFVGAPSTWIAGHAGAEGGIHVQSDPTVGTPIYLEGRVQAIEFFDLAQVHETDQKLCIPLGCYEGVLVVDEWDPLAQPEDGHQLKHYAPGVGPIRVSPLGGAEQETLVLEERVLLSTADLASASAAAVQLDERAYRFAAGVYGDTEPAEAS